MQIFAAGECLWTREVGQRQLRVALLSLEPGSRLWLSIEGEPIQFERLADDADGQSQRGFRAVGATAARWLELVSTGRTRFIEEVELVERPQDAGGAGGGYYQRDEDEVEAA